MKFTHPYKYQLFIPTFIKQMLNKIKSKIKDYNPFLPENVSYLKAFVSIYPGFAAVVLAFFKDEIVNSTSLCIINAKQPLLLFHLSINLFVTIYWLLFIGWIYSYFKALFTESGSNKKNITDIKAAIHNAPNPEIFLEYKVLLNNIFDDFQLMEDSLRNVQNHESDKGSIELKSIEVYEYGFNKTLKRLCDFTKSFATKDKDAIYGANIMGYVHNTPNTQDDIEKLKEIRPSDWFHFKEWDIKHVRGILMSLDGLMYTGGRIIPNIILPIVKTAEGEEIVLPGACKAAKDGESIIDNTDVLKFQAYDGLPDTVKKEAKNYFESRGLSIKSIISINIPVRGKSKKQLKENGQPNTLGVLNIDCNMHSPLGQEEKYYTTYYSLLKPIVYFFSYYLEDYFLLVKR